LPVKPIMNLINKLFDFNKKDKQLRPQFFIQLEKLGINKTNIATLDEKEIIRIEKILKIQSKTEAGFNQAYNDKIVAALRHHKRAIACFFEDEMLFHLIQSLPLKENQFIPFLPNDKTDLEKVKVFFSEFIEPDLIEQFKDAFNKNRLKQVVRWQYSENIFSSNFKQQIAQIIKLKLEQISENIILYTKGNSTFDNIPFATNKLFHNLLHQYANKETDEWVTEFLLYCLENSGCFSGVDFTDSIFFRLSDYPSKHENFGYLHYLTVTKAGGSNKVAAIAIVVILAVIFIPIVILSIQASYTPPKGFTMPTDPYSQNEIIREFYNQRSKKEKYVENYKYLDCDSVNLNSNYLAFFAATGAKFKIEPTINKFKTGDFINEANGFNQILPTTPDQFYFVNHHKKPVILLVYFSVCKYPRFDELYPCQYPFAWNEIYVSPNDSIKLSASALDYFSVKTGGEFNKVNVIFGYDSTIKKHDYQWCNETLNDIKLYKHTFVLSNKNLMNGGKLILNTSKNGFQLNWLGNSNALYINEQKRYFDKNETLTITKNLKLYKNPMFQKPY